MKLLKNFSLLKVLKWGLLLLLASVLIYTLAWTVWKYYLRDDSKPFAGEEKIYLAVAGPMTGDSRVNGEAMRSAVSLYVDEFNQAGIIPDKKVEVLVFDDHSDKELAKINAKAMAEESNVLAVIGHYGSSISIAAGESYKKYGIPAITATATADTITRNNEWYFRTIFNNSDQAAMVANYVKKILKYERASVIYVDDAFGKQLAQSFVTSAKSMGLKVQYQWHYKPHDEKKEAVIEQMLADLKNENRDKEEAGIVFIATHGSTAINLLQRIKSLDIKPAVEVIGADSLSSASFQRKIAEIPQEKIKPGYFTEGYYVITPFLPSIAGQSAQRFKQSFFERYQRQPTVTDYMYYDVAKMVLTAIKNSQFNVMESIEDKRAKVKNSLWKISTQATSVQGVTGFLYFDAHGDVINMIPIARFNNGTLVPTIQQYQPIEDLNSLDNILLKALDNEIIHVNGKFMRLSKLVFTGIDLIELSELNEKEGKFLAEFYLWFRYHGDLNDTNINFVNIVDTDMVIGVPIVNIVEKGNIKTRTYHIKKEFKIKLNLADYPLDSQTLAIRFKHKKLAYDQLVYVVDNLGMKLNKDTNNMLEKFKKNDVFMIGGWNIKRILFYQNNKITDSTLGMSELFSSNKRIQYSQFNLELEIERYVKSFILKTLLPVIFLIVLGYFAFFIPLSGFAQRVSLGVNLIVASSLFHLRLASALPNIGYLVLIEYIFYMIYFLAVFIILMVTIIYIFNNHIATANEQLESDDLSEEKIDELNQIKQDNNKYIDRLTLFSRIFYPLTIMVVIGYIIYYYT